jgi:hypothetical protein
MRKMHLLKLLTLVLLGTTFAYSQATRTWVSGVGDDANPCSRTAPCKTFAGAISKTAPGGEIDALDPGGFGALTITKSITIDGGGGQVASVLVAGTNGIVVAAASNDVVILRNLRFDGLLGNGGNSGNAGINGIRWISGKSLHIDHCWIFGFNTAGIDIAKSDGGKAYIDDTVVENNGAASGFGLHSVNASNTVSVSVNRSSFLGNASFGVLAGDFTSMTVRDSQANGNAFGFVAQANAGTTELNLVNSTAANNANSALFAGGGSSPQPATMRITGVSLFGDGTGIMVSTAGSVLSYGNNYNSSGGAPSGAASPGPQ